MMPAICGHFFIYRDVMYIVCAGIHTNDDE